MHATWYSVRSMVCTLAFSVVATTLVAQLSVGPGVSVPVGNYGAVDNSGWNVLGAALLRSPVANLPLRLDGMYSVTTHQGDGGYTRIIGGSAGFLWRSGQESQKPALYLFAGLGVYDVNTTTSPLFCSGAPCGTSSSQAHLAWTGGGGLTLPLGPAIGFLEARYLTIRTPATPTNLYALSFGLVFGPR